LVMGRGSKGCWGGGAKHWPLFLILRPKSAFGKKSLKLTVIM
jgi:hypothetical protein